MTQAFSFRLNHVLKGSPRTLLIAALLSVMLGFTAFAATPAANAASPSTTQTTHCAVVLPPQHEQTSRLLCAQGNQPLVVPSSCVVLITVFVDTHFTGSSTQIFGCSGPCDASGYHIDTMPSGFNNDISSYKASSNCNFVRLYTGTDETGSCIETGNSVGTLVGTGFNDQTSSMRLNSTDHISATCPLVGTSPQ